MTVEANVYAALNALAPAGGVWPVMAADDNTVFPKIIYSRIAGIPDLPLAGGTPAYEEVRLQVDVYARDYLTAKNLAESVKAAMVALQATVPNWLINNMDGVEPEVKLIRVILEFGMRG